jgi:hypothetical protein
MFLVVQHTKKIEEEKNSKTILCRNKQSLRLQRINISNAKLNWKIVFNGLELAMVQLGRRILPILFEIESIHFVIKNQSLCI